MLKKILVVDDDLVNLDIISEHLDDEAFDIHMAENGIQALKVLKANPKDFSVVLLDWMMPGMTGMQVLENMRKDSQLRFIQVVFQTAKVMKNDVINGLNAGASQYLKKPFKRDELMAALNSALIDYKIGKAIEEVNESDLFDPEQKFFKFDSLGSIPSLVKYLCSLCPDPKKVDIGFKELCFNAVEHGLAEISYEEKSALLSEGYLEQEIQNRLAMPENEGKFASVTVNLKNVGRKKELHFLIEDPGNGFVWQDYLEISSERMTDSHGRGVAMAKMLSFDRLEYRGNGNTVLAVVII